MPTSMAAAAAGQGLRCHARAKPKLAATVPSPSSQCRMATVRLSTCRPVHSTLKR